MSQFCSSTLGAFANQSDSPETLRVIFATENKWKKILGRLQLVQVILMALFQESKWCQWEQEGVVTQSMKLRLQQVQHPLNLLQGENPTWPLVLHGWIGWRADPHGDSFISGQRHHWLSPADLWAFFYSHKQGTESIVPTNGCCTGMLVELLAKFKSSLR